MSSSSKLSPNIKQFIEEHFNDPVTGPTLYEDAKTKLRERCKTDPHFLLYHVLGYEDIQNPLHYDMIERWRKRMHRLYTLWLIPRSHLKTSVWTIGMTIFELLNNPNLRFLIVNAVYSNARGILSEIKSHFDVNETLRWLFPEYCPDLHPNRKRARLCKWTDERIDFPCSNRVKKKEGNLECLGVEMSLVSKHYDRMIFDDAVNDQNTTTKEYLNKVALWYKNALQLRHSPLDSCVRLIGTRWHFDDLYGRIIAQEGKRRNQGKPPRWLMYRRKVIEPNADDQLVSIWPERFTEEVIEETKDEVGPYVFSHQYMNEPMSEEDAIFDRDKINIIDEYDIPLNVVNFAAIDLAEESEKGGDFTVITVASFDSEGNMYVRDCVRAQLLPLEAVDVVRAVVEEWDCEHVAIENTGFQKTIIKFYKNYAEEKDFYIPWMELNRGTTSKLRRFLALQPLVARGKFHVDENINHLDDLISEMTQCTISHMPSHDDILDTLADLHAIYYAAPVRVKDPSPPANSLDALHPLDEHLETAEEFLGLEEVPYSWR